MQDGDTIESIADANGSVCRASDLERANGLEGEYDLVVGQCLAVPRVGTVPVVPPLPGNPPAVLDSQRDEPGKTAGDPYVYFPTSPMPLPDLIKYIGMGVEKPFVSKSVYER